MRGLLRKIVSTGRVAEPAPERVGDGDAVPRGSVQVRHVDAGSCNGCEVEISSASGPVTRNMAEPLRKAYDATPAPKRVVAVGDCAHDCGVFAGGYGVEGAVSDVIPVDVVVRGCPPEPSEIIESLRDLTGR